MTTVQVTIIGAVLASPLLVPVFELCRNRLSAYIMFKGWQAIFLTDKDAYFGKIVSIDKNYIKLKSIYYLHTDEEQFIQHQKDIVGKTNLVKLGEELHGPTDQMFIN